jgi:hypothetical protein
VGFDLSDQLLIRFSAFVRYWRKKWKCNGFVQDTSVIHRIQESHDSVRREELYNIIIEFGVTMKLVRLIKICLNESYSKVRIG